MKFANHFIIYQKRPFRPWSSGNVLDLAGYTQSSGPEKLNLARKPVFEITWTLMKWFFVRFNHVDNPCRLSGRHNLESETITQKLWIYSCIMVVINQAYSKSFWEFKDENDFVSFILCRELETIKCCTRWQKDWEYGFEWNTTQASRNNFMTLKHDFTVKLLLRTDFYVQLTNWL